MGVTLGQWKLCYEHADMVINAEHIVTVELLDKDRFARVIDGLMRFVRL
jgi:hypothetical protein